MSARNHSTRNEPPAAIEIPTTKLTQREMDSACRRLARVSNKSVNSSYGRSNDTPDSFAINFFNSNPDVPLDKRSPQEKLDEMNSKLADLDLEENDRFSILVQKKAICSLAFGDSSPETYEALFELGGFYNLQNRPDSAIRHLLKAQEVGRTIETTTDSDLALAIEIADSYLAIKAQNKAEQSRNLSSAENAVKPFDDIETDDKSLMFKRTLIQARIKVRRLKYADAYGLYEVAYESLDAANKGKITAQTASLFIEMGDCAEAGGDAKVALEMYQRAYDTFVDLEMNDSAKLIEPKLADLQAKCAQEEHGSNSSSASSLSSSRLSSRSSSRSKK